MGHEDDDVVMAFDESAELGDDEVVVVTGADGVERSYAVVAVVEIAEETFAVMLPEDPDEDGMLVARYHEDKPVGQRYTAVDDEDTVARVQAVLDSIGGVSEVDDDLDIA